MVHEALESERHEYDKILSTKEVKYNQERCDSFGVRAHSFGIRMYLGCNQNAIVRHVNVLVEHQVHDVVLIRLFNFIADVTVGSQGDREQLTVKKGRRGEKMKMT